jgi:formamidopyrimidine-DNA glycosylase
MPELPDVEVFRHIVEAGALHKLIVRVEIAAPRLLRGVKPRVLEERLRGSKFAATRRHGKLLFLKINRGGWLLLHFGMTGYPIIGENEWQPSDHARLRIYFAKSQPLTYFDPRKLGRIGFVDDVDAFIRSRNLGPDALMVGPDVFRERLQVKKAAAKAAFMDQHVLAGVGNVYADEILFQSAVSPLARLSRASNRTWDRLYRATREVLHRAINVGADPARLPRTYLLRQRKRDGRCPRCHAQLQTMKIGGRTTYYCPREQKNPA